MSNGEEPGGDTRAIVYCLVPRDLAAKVHEPLRRHFREDPSVEVVVERRDAERRRSGDRRAEAAPEAASTPDDRRVIRASEGGRRAGERRATQVAVPPPNLPRRVAPYAERLTFVERLEPSSQHLEDLDTARVVARFQAGDAGAFALLYERYFNRVYSYLRILLREPHDAEDAAQQVFINVLDALPRYERRRQPFRSWVFAIARNHALNHLSRSGRLQPEDPNELNRRRELAGEPEERMDVLGWITDRDLLLFIERLPVPQRQVLVLRYMLDLSYEEIARMLNRTAVDVRSLQSKAVRFLRARLEAVSRDPGRGRRIRMRAPMKYAPVLRKRRWALR